MSIKAIVGLGNPGQEYANTRHNLGFMVVDALARSVGASAWKSVRRYKAMVADGTVGDTAVHFVKPETFMNDSGSSIQRLSSYYKWPPNSLIVVYDDITVELGRVKINVQGSAGGHNGVESVLRHIGPGFIRYRIGIGGKSHPEMDLAEHVLGRLMPEESAILEKNLPKFIQGIHLLVDKGPESAMNEINQKNKTNDGNAN
tara:strand:- start:50838 stop:51440 length:603 start_codon:yes stop_codon:yes gene_type:complete